MMLMWVSQSHLAEQFKISGRWENLACNEDDIILLFLINKHYVMWKSFHIYYIMF